MRAQNSVLSLLRTGCDLLLFSGKAEFVEVSVAAGYLAASLPYETSFDAELRAALFDRHAAVPRRHGLGPMSPVPSTATQRWTRSTGAGPGEKAAVRSI
jgi:hypothetical protein